MFKIPKSVLLIGAAAPLGITTLVWWAYEDIPKNPLSWPASSNVVFTDIPKSPLSWPASRNVVFTDSKDNLDLTLFQYQTCPFCCKVRAYLDFKGISYKVVEVNSVTQKQIKWSEYHKVPIMVVRDKEGFIQLNDSSLIISALESYRLGANASIKKLLDYYLPFDTTDARGRKKIDFYNKYQIMSGQTNTDVETKKVESNWRKWVDEEFVHVLAPNIYRTPSEALEAFKYVSKCGDWDTNFGRLQSEVLIYIGAVAMYFIGKILKRRYALKDDVRESLFEEAHIWVGALGSQMFMGGNEPNLADLAVYGVLNSIEGCSAFKELMNQDSTMFSWYLRTKQSLKQPYRNMAT